jgi:exopolyphosphatase / guanosine-5'-triphosphate,3'-diphosphate pyrophosphatase
VQDREVVYQWGCGLAVQASSCKKQLRIPHWRDPHAGCEHELVTQKSLPKVVAFLDLGTNSIRLLLVRINPDLSFTVISRQKEVARLGEGEFVEQALQMEAMQRAAQICRQFAELARSRHAQEIIAVATSATREAANQAEFVQLVKETAGFDLHVVSGKEEARLIYLGVSRGIKLDSAKTLFIDIGGGSTETIVGDQTSYDFLETHRLGAIRLASLFFLPDESGPIDAIRYELIKNYVRNATVRTIQHLKEYPLRLVVGSSGTITNLAEVAFRYSRGRDFGKDDSVTREELSSAMRMLCKLPLAERRQVPGINAHRADIIIPGGAILETILEALDLNLLRTSERGLLEGLLVDYLARHDQNPDLKGLSIREQSVLHFGRAVHFEEAHAQTVARLALELFDTAQAAGLHQLGAAQRELLRYAALLHDSGTFISYANHQAHSYYLVRNADLLGFDEAEIAIIATTVLFHRRSGPGRKQKEYSLLEKEAQEIVQVLSMLLRLAETLDRSHASIIQQARLIASERKTICLELSAEQDCSLELNGLKPHLEPFQELFHQRLEIRQVGGQST